MPSPGCFTAPSFAVFTAVVVGMIAQTGQKTVCGMLTGAGLVQTWSHDWSHDWAHRFFARAVWSIDTVGLVVLDLIVTPMLPAGAVIVLAVDDTASTERGIRYRDEDGHNSTACTLNGSAVATPRLWAALVEHGQQADGRVRLPKALHSYMDGEYIKPRKRS